MNMHGTETAWSVEARSSCAGFPIDCGERLILTNEKWSRVPFIEGPIGVPSKSIFGIAEMVHLLTYEAAQALRWWFVASMKAKHKHGIETRLVMHSIKYSIEAKEVGADESLCDIEYLKAAKAIEHREAAATPPTQPKGESA